MKFETADEPVARHLLGHTIIVDLGRTEGVLPSKEQTPRETYRPGDRIVAYVKAIGIGLAGMRTVLVDREPGAEFGDVLAKSAPESVWRVRWLWVAPGYAAATTVVCDDCVNADQIAHRHAS